MNDLELARPTWVDWRNEATRAAERRPSRPIRATLVRLDGSVVRRTTLSTSDEFVFCLRTSRYYDRMGTSCTYLERFYPHHRQSVKELRASQSADPLDVNRAACGLPIWIAGGWML